MHLLSIGLLIVGLVQTITADIDPVRPYECCHPSCSCYPNQKGTSCGACSDCYRGSICCGNGACNIFCCNCDDGCRKGNCYGNGQHCQASAADVSLKPQIPIAFQGGESDAQARFGNSRSTFDLIDSDHSGSIELEEYLVWASNRNEEVATNATLKNMYIQYFYRFDEDGDGKVSYDEMHRPAKEAVSEL